MRAEEYIRNSQALGLYIGSYLLLALVFIYTLIVDKEDDDPDDPAYS